MRAVGDSFIINRASRCTFVSGRASSTTQQHKNTAAYVRLIGVRFRLAWLDIDPDGTGLDGLYSLFFSRAIYVVYEYVAKLSPMLGPGGHLL